MSSEPVLLNDFRRQWADTKDDVLAAVAETGESGWYVLGQQVREFESALAAFWGLDHAIGVASGLDAIEIALRAAGLRPGDRVLTTPLSAFATTMAIVRQGAIPVFCDTTVQGQMDLDEADQALRAMPGIRFLLPVHLYGIPLPAEKLRKLIEVHGLSCVEDCAQSIAANTGRAGLAAATSFYPTKNLGALGDGGAVLTGDAALAARVRQLRDYGQSAKYEHAEIGWNSRLDELHAAVLRRAFLPRLSQWTARRREIAGLYLSQWRSRTVRPVACVEDLPGSCWHLFPTRICEGTRETVAAHLKRSQIATAVHYPAIIPSQPAMSGVNHAEFGDLPRARALAATELSLPIHPYMTNDEVARVLAALPE
ncbi:MAG: DegT/DnrJ/EryC1/StrS family aminotransferase [Acidobacteria bacterium]|nr:DegT/DnrJ/EryC1/StrS family aminotransferase [Acidobacteriota bacterium]